MSCFQLTLTETVTNIQGISASLQTKPEHVELTYIRVEYNQNKTRLFVGCTETVGASITSHFLLQRGLSSVVSYPKGSVFALD